MPSDSESFAPVHDDGPSEPAGPARGLCLSGGGYRAMLFHLGVLWRLNEAGWLGTLDRVSSVSGGSITAATLASRWSDLSVGADGVASNFVDLVGAPLRRLAGRTIDVGSVLRGALWTGTVGDRVAAAYARHLFGEATLQDLPDDAAGAPRFIFNATSLQSGALWRFTRETMGDYRVGYVRRPTLPLAQAVAASSAFPPFLSPAVLRLDPDAFAGGSDLGEPAYRSRIVLTDGGAYDNLGLERVWKACGTVLVSDAGKKLAAETAPRRFWPLQFYRVVTVIDNQVRSLRIRQTQAAFHADPESGAPHREGAYWGIRQDLAAYAARYGLDDVLDCPHAATLDLAATPTRLKRLSARRQERLINWGYAACDTALRARVDRTLPRGAFPYARGVAG